MPTPLLASLASTYALIILIMFAGITLLIVLLRRMLGRPPRRHYRTERIQIGQLLCRDGIIFTDDWSMRDHLLLPDINLPLTITISRRFAGKSVEITVVSLVSGDPMGRFQKHGEFIVDTGLVFILSAHLQSDPSALEQFKRNYIQSKAPLDEIWPLKTPTGEIVGLVFLPVYGDGAYAVLIRRSQTGVEIKSYFASG